MGEIRLLHIIGSYIQCFKKYISGSQGGVYLAVLPEGRQDGGGGREAKSNQTQDDWQERSPLRLSPHGLKRHIAGSLFSRLLAPKVGGV